MDRINGAGHVGRMFVAEDAGLGRPPTEITEAWLNGVQEELCAVIEAAGIALNVNNSVQLLAALRAAGVFQTQARSDRSTKVATTEFANPGSSFGTLGYALFAGGLMIQWGGYAHTVAGASMTQTFGYAFPNACLGIFSSQDYQQNGGTVVGVSPSSKTTFISNSLYGSDGFNIFAIGN